MSVGFDGSLAENKADVPVSPRFECQTEFSFSKSPAFEQKKSLLGVATNSQMNCSFCGYFVGNVK